MPDGDGKANLRRFYIREEKRLANKFSLSGQEAHHLRVVLRAALGDEVELFDGKGAVYLATIVSIDKNSVDLEIKGDAYKVAPPAVSIALGQALLKSSNFDFVIQKAVELGVSSIAPIVCERVVSKPKDPAKRFKRWRQILIESAKQCSQNLLPEFATKIESINSFCVKHESTDLKLILWEKETVCKYKALNLDGVESVAVLSGPEGGFSEDEIDLSRSLGFISVSLGPRVLRAETAPIVILSLLQNSLGDF